MKVLHSLIAGAALLSVPGSALAQLMLVTPQEAARPEGVVSRGVFPGPAIKLIAPEPDQAAHVLASPFHLKLQFTPRNGTSIDVADVKVTYVKSPSVDLTPRLLTSLSNKGIDVQRVALPAGKHTFEVLVADSQGHLGEATFTLLVAK